MNSKCFIRCIQKSLFLSAAALVANSSFAAGDWLLNPAGNGSAAATTVSSTNVAGVGYVQLLPGSSPVPYAFDFVENGAYQILNATGTAPFGSHDLTATYQATGYGNSLDPTALGFTSGRINLYSDTNFDFATVATNYGADNGTLIAAFDITDGHVADAMGTVTINATGVIGSFRQGYLFTANGTDMSTLTTVQLQLNISNSVSTPDPLIISGVVCGLAQACPGGNVTLSQYAFTVQDHGTVSISAVPEPASAAMLLAGLGIVTGIARRHRRANH